MDAPSMFNIVIGQIGKLYSKQGFNSTLPDMNYDQQFEDKYFFYKMPIIVSVKWKKKYILWQVHEEQCSWLTRDPQQSKPS